MKVHYKEEAADFVRKQDFGLLPSELKKYLLGMEEANGRCFDKEVDYCKSLFSQPPEWSIYANTLLQQKSMPVFLSGKTLSARRRAIINTLHPASQVLSIDYPNALARIFFEIEEAFDDMLKRNDVSKGCGYRVLRLLHEEQGPISTNEMMRTFKYHKNYVNDPKYYKERTIQPLLDRGLIVRNNGDFVLHPKTETAFEIVESKAKEIRKLAFRRPWFYPFENGRNTVAIST